MPYTITSQCIGCSRCQPVCPTGAIQQAGPYFWIETNLCNNCVGDYGTPQCVAACPTNGGCIPDVQEFWGHWFQRYNNRISRLHGAKQAEYWEQWFDAYSQKISSQLANRQLNLAEAQS